MNLIDLHPDQAALRREVLEGLRKHQKTLSPKLLYDRLGSMLFERICKTPEYYLTRAERKILSHCMDDLAGLVGEEVVVVEFGSGSSEKTALLLENVSHAAGYVPIDLSRNALEQGARTIKTALPKLPTLPVCADFTRPLRLPLAHFRSTNFLAFMPGSTIGNFDPPAARNFLAHVGRSLGRASKLLIGFDLVKAPPVLQAAYDDSLGVTAQFNLNLLTRLNRELDANFDLCLFVHKALYRQSMRRIEMHLESLIEQEVNVAGVPIFFRRGETIHTENSYKFSPDDFASLASSVGYRPLRFWTDPERLFGVYLLAFDGVTHAAA